MLTILLAATLASQPALPVVISAHREGRSCRVSVGGRQLAWPLDERRLLAEFRRYRREGRSALFRIQPDTPYRCVGVVFYLAQRARLDMPMGFVGNELER